MIENEANEVYLRFGGALADMFIHLKEKVSSTSVDVDDW